MVMLRLNRHIEPKNWLRMVPVTKKTSAFADRHTLALSPAAAGKAVAGMRLLKDLGVWNPMEGFRVNDNPSDGECKWHLLPPLGLNLIGQKGLLLMHYPPWQIIEEWSFLDCMTMNRWNTVLEAAGVPKEQVSFFRTIVDVNPIAAPGFGQSEYPNDYFPIMMASAFFDGPGDRDYLRSMLELYLAPPGGGGQRYTLPLLVCGSPLYDPPGAGLVPDPLQGPPADQGRHPADGGAAGRQLPGAARQRARDALSRRQPHDRRRRHRPVHKRPLKDPGHPQVRGAGPGRGLVPPCLRQ
jgi:hypothetical protein